MRLCYTVSRVLHVCACVSILTLTRRSSRKAFHESTLRSRRHPWPLIDDNVAKASCVLIQTNLPLWTWRVPSRPRAVRSQTETRSESRHVHVESRRTLSLFPSTASNRLHSYFLVFPHLQWDSVTPLPRGLTAGTWWRWWRWLVGLRLGSRSWCWNRWSPWGRGSAGCTGCRGRRRWSGARGWHAAGFEADGSLVSDPPGST